MWIAKNKDTGQTYGHKFNSIYDCQDFIDKELKDEQKEAFENFINSKSKKYTIDDLPKKYKKYSLDYQQHIVNILNILERFRFSMCCNRILCWNTTQKRFCDGFDF